MELTWLALTVPLVLGVLFLLAGVGSFRRRRGFSGTVSVLSALLAFSLAAIMGLVAVGMRGFQALTSEQTAATMTVSSEGGQRFRVQFEYPDGTRDDYGISGDELYVDARILKWHPAASFVGLRTGYQLDRIAGRYRELGDELTLPRTLFQLRDPEQVDLFGAVRRFPALKGLVDAEYGSASFLPVEDGGIYQLRVTASGLIIRQLN